VNLTSQAEASALSHRQILVAFSGLLIAQVLVVAVQNNVAREQLGTATGTANSFRSLGGAVGVVVFGAVFAARLTHWLPLRLPALVARNVNPAALISSRHRLGISRHPSTPASW
jgi:hypothetical protein